MSDAPKEFWCNEDCWDGTSSVYSPNFSLSARITEGGIYEKVSYFVHGHDGGEAEVTREDWLALAALKQAGVLEGLRTQFAEAFHEKIDGNVLAVMIEIAEKMPCP